MIGLREDQQMKATLVSRIDRLFFVASELAPAGARSGPQEGDCCAVQREQASSPQNLTWVAGFAASTAAG